MASKSMVVSPGMETEGALEGGLSFLTDKIGPGCSGVLGSTGVYMHPGGQSEAWQVVNDTNFRIYFGIFPLVNEMSRQFCKIQQGLTRDYITNYFLNIKISPKVQNPQHF